MKFEIPAEQYLQISHSTLDTGLSYFDTGSGEVILFIHGLGSSKECWLKNISAFSSQFRCIVPDLPGYGRSAYIKFKPDTRHYATVLLQLIDQIHPKSIKAIVGHSMGGLIAGCLAAMAPDRFQKLILIAPAGFETYNVWQQQSIMHSYNPVLLRNVSDEQIFWNYRLNFHQMPEDANYLIKQRKLLSNSPQYDQYCHTVAANVQHMVSTSFAGMWEKVNARVLLLHGAQDKLIPNPLSGNSVQEHLLTIKKRHSHFRLVSIRNTGHFVMWERSDICNQLFKTFLDEEGENQQ